MEQNKLIRFTGLGLTLCSLITVAGQSLAAEVTVSVFDRSKGSPLRDAAVCLGTFADPTQFGSAMSPRDGDVVFGDVPTSELVVTVSKDGFLGYQRRASPMNSDRVFVVALPKGGLGPVCSIAESKTASSGQFAVRSGIRVHAFRIENGARSTQQRLVTLGSRVSGSKPTQYRASESRDFSDTEWKNYESTPRFALSEGAGRKTIYYQARRYHGSNAGSIVSESRVVSDNIVLQAP